MKKNILLILVFALCNVFTVSAQNYEYWGDDYFENDSLVVDTIPVESFFQTSKGLFAKPLNFWRVNLAASLLLG